MKLTSTRVRQLTPTALPFGNKIILYQSSPPSGKVAVVSACDGVADPWTAGTNGVYTTSALAALPPLGNNVDFASRPPACSNGGFLPSGIARAATSNAKKTGARQ